MLQPQIKLVKLPRRTSIEAIWNETYPTEVYDSNFVDEQINSYYNSEKIMGILLKHLPA
ncbi:hypothetical protein [Pedobacter nototheniae]|uniref:hypothetical protein n=1 Tax=Pedobacter nototheniae TaxID=2488994 RepID=UPI0013F3F4FA|nr:hypothetical protein [Pedobacter nototheniae]